MAVRNNSCVVLAVFGLGCGSAMTFRADRAQLTRLASNDLICSSSNLVYEDDEAAVHVDGCGRHAKYAEVCDGPLLVRHDAVERESADPDGPGEAVVLDASNACTWVLDGPVGPSVDPPGWYAYPFCSPGSMSSRCPAWSASFRRPPPRPLLPPGPIMRPWGPR